MTYAEKLKHPNWQKKRLDVLNRDEFTCKLCGDKETTLHVHHKEYDGDPWNVSLDRLITLCQDCHKVIEVYKLNPEDIRATKKNAFKEDGLGVILMIENKDNDVTVFLFNMAGEKIVSSNAFGSDYIENLYRLLQNAKNPPEKTGVI